MSGRRGRRVNVWTPPPVADIRDDLRFRGEPFRPNVLELGIVGAFNTNRETRENPRENPFIPYNLVNIEGSNMFNSEERRVLHSVYEIPDIYKDRNYYGRWTGYVSYPTFDPFTRRGVPRFNTKYYVVEDLISRFLDNRNRVLNEAQERVRRIRREERSRRIQQEEERRRQEVERRQEEERRKEEKRRRRVIHLRLPQLIDFIYWRLGIGDNMINGDNRDFPLGRGPQMIRGPYTEIRYVTHMTDNVSRRVYLDTNEYESDFNRGGDFFNHSYVGDIGVMCLRHFLDEALKSFLEGMGITDMNIEPRIYDPNSRRDPLVVLLDRIRNDYERWIQTIYNVYKCDRVIVEDLARRIHGFLTLATEPLASGNYAVGYRTYRELAKSLTTIYTTKVSKFSTVKPLYGENMRAATISGLLYLVKYLYRGDDREILDMQRDLLIHGSNTVLNTHIDMDNFDEWLRDPKLIWRMEHDPVVYDDGYDFDVEVVNNPNNIIVIGEVNRNAPIIDNPALPNIEKRGCTVEGGGGMAIGKYSQYLYDGSNRIPRYFGDTRYDLGYSEEQKAKWVDNSNSANLCGITSILYNGAIAEIFKDKDTSELIALILLVTGKYKDEAFRTCLRGEVNEILRIICVMIRMYYNRQVEIISYELSRGVSVDTGKYRWNGKYYKTNEYGKEKTTLKRVKSLNPELDIIRISLVYVEGHVYNVTDGNLFSESEHLQYIKSKFGEDFEPNKSDTEFESLINHFKIYRHLEYLIKNKHLYVEYRELWERVEHYESYYLTRADYNELYDIEERLNGGKKRVCKSDMDYYYEFMRRYGVTSLKQIRGIGMVFKNKIHFVYDLETVMRFGRSYIDCISIRCLEDPNAKTFMTLLGDEEGYTKLTEKKLVKQSMLWIFSTTCRMFPPKYNRKTRDYDNYNLPSIKIIAHNGGCFDNVIFRDILCSSIEDKVEPDLRILLRQDIIGGGVMKMLIGEFICNRYIKGDLPKYELAYTNTERLIDFTFMDSCLILKAPLKDLGVMYGLEGVEDKKAYPYKFYDSIINNNLPYKYTHKELMSLKLEEGAKRDLTKYILATGVKDEYDFMEIMRDYCEHDTYILAKAIQKAHELYHSIDLSIIKPGSEALINPGGAIISTSSKGVKASDLSFKDSITLSGFAKKIAKHVTFEGAHSYTSIANDYLSVYTGGLTYCRDVDNFISSKMCDIARNPYFYINPDKHDLIYLFSKYGYDRNKEKRTWNIEGPIPREVTVLKESLRDVGGSLCLLDANSLYPSAMSSIEFPIGEEYRIESFEQVLESNKMFIAYFEVEWTPAGIEAFKQKIPPIHQLIITTPEGNRHLRPDDIESKHYGMTSVCYRSIMKNNTGLFNLRFINGVYWERSTSLLSDLNKMFYNLRLRMKLSRSKVEGCCKLILNSFYGILLEKCHIINSEYKPNTYGGYKLNTDTMNIERTINKAIDRVRCQMLKDARIKGMDMDWYARVETKVFKKLKSYIGMGHWASFVLDRSKEIMFELFFKAQQLGGELKYSDTDSAFFSTDIYFKLLENTEGLMGKELGQFKSDFDDKFKASKASEELKKSNAEYKSKYIVKGIVDGCGVVSIASIFLAKKLYCNVLLSTQSDDFENYYLEPQFQATGKSIMKEKLTYRDYELLLDDNVKYTQDRSEYVNVFHKKLKTNEGIIVTDPSEANRKRCFKTIRNQNSYRKEMAKKKVKLN